MRFDPIYNNVSVVMLGKFNPAIFTPAWFMFHEILPQHVVNNAELKIAHQELTMFSAEWLYLSIDRNRFEAQTQIAPYSRLYDFLLRVFKEHLNHTPIEAMGINREVDFQVKSQVERDRIGKLLAPIEPWGKWKDKLELDSEYGGMSSLTMSQHHLPDRPQGGSVNITVRPSIRIPGSRSGISVNVNDHYSTDTGGIEGRTQLIDLLKNQFHDSIHQSDAIINHIMSL